MTACARPPIQSSTFTPSRLGLRRLVELSRRCGRSSAWAATVGAPSRSPALATVCDVAGALGYRVAAREGGSQEG